MKRLYLWGWSSTGGGDIPSLLSASYEIIYWVGANEKCTHNIFSVFRGKLNHRYYGKGRKHYASVYENIHTFIGMYSRHKRHFRYQQYDDFINIFNQYFDFFYDQLSTGRIDTVLFSNIPHEGPDYILYLIAKQLGIEVIITHQSLFPNHFFVFKSMSDFGIFNEIPEVSPYERYKIPNVHKKKLFYMQNIEESEERLKDNIFKLAKLIVNRKLEKFCIEYESMMIRIRHQNYLKNNTLTCEDYPKIFIYFPLQLQPELTTSALGGRYSDQVLAIEELHSILPDNWFICVKENPKQTEFKRGEHFYARLSAMNKVRLYDPSVDTYELINKSQFVATITGTAGWEAITGGKHVLVFGQVWYQSLPGVIHINELTSLSDILKYKINHNELEKKLSNLMVKTGRGVVDPAFSELVKGFSCEKNARSVVDVLSHVME